VTRAPNARPNRRPAPNGAGDDRFQRLRRFSTRLRVFPTFLTAFFTADADRPVFFIAHFVVLAAGHPRPVLLAPTGCLFLRCRHLVLLLFDWTVETPQRIHWFRNGPWRPGNWGLVDVLVFDMSKKDNIDRVWDIVEKVGVCMLTTQFVGGLRARPLEARPDRDAGLIFS
jgi:hypothetical protein